jgi:hypothetical protein
MGDPGGSLVDPRERQPLVLWTLQRTAGPAPLFTLATGELRAQLATVAQISTSAFWVW